MELKIPSGAAARRGGGIDMEIKWHDGFVITVRSDGDSVVLSANREGLLSLAEILKSVAEQQAGYHVHLDETNSLEEGSAELIVEKTD